MYSMGNPEKPKKFVQTAQVFQSCEFDLIISVVLHCFP